VVTDY